MVGDRIADMLTRIRNANQMRYETVEVLGSKATLGIAEILKREGYIADFVYEKNIKGDKLNITLKYGAKKESTINSKRPTFKVIIAGGRDFDDYNMLKTHCDKILENKRNQGYRIIIISGTARGADILGERYAKEKGYEVLRFPADWNTYGKRAGYIRNEEMSEHADACICFWDSISNGTRHMINIAKEKRLPLRIVTYINDLYRF